MGNGERLIAQADGGQDLQDFFQIVTIDHFGPPAKGRETALVDFHIVTKSRRLALTQAVHVDNRDKVVEIVSTSQRRGFPNAPLGAFALAKQDIGAEVKVIEPGAQGHADAHT